MHSEKWEIQSLKIPNLHIENQDQNLAHDLDQNQDHILGHDQDPIPEDVDTVDLDQGQEEEEQDHDLGQDQLDDQRGQDLGQSLADPDQGQVNLDQDLIPDLGQGHILGPILVQDQGVERGMCRVTCIMYRPIKFLSLFLVLSTS